MICFEIWINGIKKYTVGSEEAEEFSANLTAFPHLKPTHVSLDVCGFTLRDEAYPDELRWGESYPKIGDEIIIKIIDTNNPDKPKVTRYKEGCIDNSDSQSQSMLCSCCGKSHFETDKLIRNSNIALCEDCIKMMADLINNK